jgi:antitoxin (DNA-binding transcriptional repressor) of toxin-antitoxin stability system
MQVVSMHQAKSTLSQLVKRASSGETILLGAYGKIEAKLTAATTAETPGKRIGLLAGKLTIPDDFDAPLPEALQKAFEGDDA